MGQGMKDRGMRRSGAISAAVHIIVILIAVLALPKEKLPETASSAVDVRLVGPSVPQQALHKGKVPAPAKTPVPNPAHLAKHQPKPKPIALPPPPPPPPPPSPRHAVTLPKPPAPAPPPPPARAPIPLPKPPPPQPRKPQKPVIKPQPKLPLPPKPQPPAPAPKSPTSQKHPIKKPAPMSKAVLNTLSKLRALQKQDKPPTAHYNPQQGGAPHGGGTKMSTANSRLSAADRSAIGSEVQPCWGIDAGAPGVSHFSVLLQVVTDASGVVREAQVAAGSQDQMSDPLYAAFAQRAVQAVKNYQCAKLPLPNYMLGKPQQFVFRFTP
jgi:hypothetical protein